MTGIFSETITPSTIGIAFGLLGALIAFHGFLVVSDRGLSARSSGNQAHDSGAIRELCGQRYDLRWAAFFIAIGFGLQLAGAVFPEARINSYFAVELLIGLAAYLLIRGPTIRHDVATALQNLKANNASATDAPVARFPRVAA